jgi:putative DNA methylase
MEYKKKLIEVALPLEAINAASAYERDARYTTMGILRGLCICGGQDVLLLLQGQLSGLLWLTTRPADPEEFPTEEEQNKERQRLFGILERLV